MKLSIITVNLNNNLGLEKTIESVLNQIFKDFEHIIVDGASVDESLETIKNYSTKTDFPIYCLSESDSGVYHAMNKGIRLAKGDYLLFLNSGDYLVNEHVLSQIFSSEVTVDLLIGRSNISKNNKIIYTTDIPNKITFDTLFNQGLSHQATFIKRDLFEKFGYYKEDFRFHGDIEFWYRTIVLNLCTTQTINIIISDYNIDGISFIEAESEISRNEVKRINSLPLLQLFVPDYESMRNGKEEMKPLLWIKSKKFFYFPLLLIYNLIKFLKDKHV